MKGIHQVIVETKRIRFSFFLRRNLTVIRGDSATGKTTLVDMIQQYIDNPSGSPVQVRCDKSCYVLAGALWKSALSGIRNGIVFIDEGNEFVATTEFAESISRTDNYYVIITRESLPSLPYSVEEIYGIHESGRYGTLKQTYNEFYRIYKSEVYSTRGKALAHESRKQKLILTEDSGAGFDFFEKAGCKKGMRCKTAGGKSNVFQETVNADAEVSIIADGAAFGPEIDRMMRLIASRKGITLYLPESFEWLVLRSEVFNNKEVGMILENPSDFIESGQYFSWERFFNDYLVRISKDTYLQYNKRKLNTNYLKGDVFQKILAVIPDAFWKDER